MANLPAMGVRSRLVMLLTALCLLPLGPGAGAGAASQDEDVWEQFLADRPTFFQALAPPFVECFARRDSAIDPLSPIFHGCIDWHSAAHAAYSHHVVYRRTGDQDFLDLANAQIEPAGVSLVPAEFAYQKAKGLDLPLSENPYGFGWFLLLARERELSTGRTDFREMADYAAAQMVNWYRARTNAGDANTFIQNEAHSNYSWSLINLDVWARHTGDPLLLAAVHDASRPLFNPSLDTSCPATRDRSTNRGGFQPACMMRLAAAAHVWGDQVRDWVTARLPAEGGLDVPPVTAPVNCHAGGQNFAKAFALYQLYLVTGDTAYRDNYAELIRYHVGRPDLYIDPSYAGNPGYLCYSHWVAQFGVRSISLSYEDRPATPDVPFPAAQTAVSVEHATAQAGTLSVAGGSVYADQPFVQVGTDPSGDTDLPGALGHDLVSFAVSSKLDGRIQHRFEVASLPPVTGRGPRVNYGWAFCFVSEELPECYEIDAWSTGVDDPEPEVQVWRCESPACVPAGQILTDIAASASFNGPGRTVTVDVFMEDLGADPGATLTRVAPVDAPVYTSLGLRHGPGDRLEHDAVYRTGLREVSIGAGAPGQDPAAVDYTQTVVPGEDGSYAGEVDVSDLAPGTYAVYVRACFGAGNCGYDSRTVTV